MGSIAIFLLLFTVLIILPHESEGFTNSSTVIKLVASLTKNEEYVDARNELKKVKTYATLLAPIVEKLYNGNGTRTQQILQLFGEISCSAYAEGLEKLMNKTVEHGKLTDTQVLIIARYMEVLGCLNNDKVAQLSTSFKTHVDSFFDKWALKMEREDFGEIYNFVKLGYYERDSFNRQVGKIIDKVYANSSANAFNTTLKFANGLPYLNEVAAVYKSIVDVLKKQGETYGNDMITISYWVHFRIKTDWDRMPKYTQDLYTELKNSIPTEIRNLFWHNFCGIQNIQWNEYLFATNETRSNADGNGDVFTWMPGTPSSSGEWTLTSGREKNGNVYFYIKNTYLMGMEFYLCESKSTKSVMTCSDGTNGYREWFLKYSSNEFFSGFLVKNSQFNSIHQDYLQATSKIHGRLNRRNVEDSGLKELAYWKIDCN